MDLNAVRETVGKKRRKGESQNGCLKKTKRAKFSKKRTFLTPALPPLKRTRACISGVKKCSFSANFGMLCFLETPVLRFAFSPYYRRDVQVSLWYSLDSNIFLKYLKLSYHSCASCSKVGMVLTCFMWLPLLLSPSWASRCVCGGKAGPLGFTTPSNLPPTIAIGDWFELVSSSSPSSLTCFSCQKKLLIQSFQVVVSKLLLASNHLLDYL